MEIYIVQSLRVSGYESYYENEGAFTNKKEAFKSLISINDDTRKIVVWDKEKEIREHDYYEILKNHSLTNQQVLEKLRQGKSVWLNNHTEIKSESALRDFTLEDVLNATFIGR